MSSTLAADASTLPVIPRPAQLWRPLSFWITAAYALLLLAAIPPIVVDYWFLDSVGASFDT